MLNRTFSIAVTIFALAGCGTTAPEPRPEVTQTLYERRLEDILTRQEALFEQAVAGQIDEAAFTRRVARLASDYDGLLASNPNDVLAYVSYGKFLRRIGRREDAHLMFSKANQLNPKLAVVKQQIGNYLAEEGRHGQALSFYMAAIDLEPDEAAYHHSLGELYAHFGNLFVRDEAMSEEAVDAQMLAAFARAKELAPEKFDFALRYAEAFYDLFDPRWEDALGVWEELGSHALPELESDAVRLHTARVLIELGRNDRAAELLDQEVVSPLTETRSALLARIASASR